MSARNVVMVAMKIRKNANIKRQEASLQEERYMLLENQRLIKTCKSVFFYIHF